jgi:outer membrane protein assembly factor BamB
VRVFSLLSILLPALAFPLRADEWPMMGGRPDRNPVSSEKNLPATFSEKDVKWTAPLGTITYSCPVVAGGRVFVGTNNREVKDPKRDDKGVVLCLSAADGTLLWKAVHDKLPEGSAQDTDMIGVTSTPAVVGERVYYVSNRAEAVCRNAATGAVIWLLDMRKELGVRPNQAASCSPVVADGKVFVITGHGADYKEHKVKDPKAPSFIALDAASGKVLWQDNSPGDRIMVGTWGSPSYGVVEGQAQAIFPGGDGWLYSFEPTTGKLLWKFNCKVQENRKPDGSPETENYVLAAPVFAGYRVLTVNGVDTETSGDPGCIRAIDARKRGDITKEGELWHLHDKEFCRSITSPAVQDGLVYATQQLGVVNCIDLETGKVIWNHDLLSTVCGTPLVADGKIYIRTGDGDIVVMKTGREKKVLAKNTLPDLEHGYVVASDGLLYIASWKKLYVIGGGK